MVLPQKIDRANAEQIAVGALAYLAADEGRLRRFLDVTGLDPGTIRRAAASPRFLAAVLEYVMGDEALLLAFAEHHAVAPEHVGAALRALAPSDPDG